MERSSFAIVLLLVVILGETYVYLDARNANNLLIRQNVQLEGDYSDLALAHQQLTQRHNTLQMNYGNLSGQYDELLQEWENLLTQYEIAYRERYEEGYNVRYDQGYLNGNLTGYELGYLLEEITSFFKSL